MGRRTTAHMATAVAAAIVLMASVSAAQESTSLTTPQATEPSPARRLDLRIPSITSLYTQEQITVFLARTRADNLEEVEVEGRREPRHSVTPDVWGGIAAPVWAMLHPTQAWRIFAPLPPDQVRRLQKQKPDATDPYRATAARSARDP